ncbi:SDR family NAD(P)-dependent oxidoreductase [Hydrogenovibrio sp. 3SP14C1]|uniref:SDR family NAD(P)-dependent oxidoreductase n=1 Tax=Hydrogenovibrio sp. 3SP14C1 TaxID=3038774 RepID=UPI00241683CB|nr:SDR family NAD(P)-dependent oxidoreductase [Hydrogenovibrio sp. 3SP14C1]MDG4811509.1 SDR family NAD(P)-dependent oxidoreductase [Hydrogenovibrio sp. 3SP14C1]
MKRIWIVGASSGIGLSLTQSLLQADYLVVASSRTAEQSDALAVLQKQFGNQLQRLNVDVTQPDDLVAKVDQAWSFFEGIDIWFYNAGAYQPMSFDAFDYDAFASMNAVNYLGCVAMMVAMKKRVLQKPDFKMRWIWNISIASQVGLPYGGAYSAPKAALLNLAESIKPELDCYGVTLQVINHGFVKTRLTDKNPFEMPGLLMPDDAAKKIAQFIHYNDTTFEMTFPKKMTLFLKFLKILPYRWVFFITKRVLK